MKPDNLPGWCECCLDVNDSVFVFVSMVLLNTYKRYMDHLIMANKDVLTLYNTSRNTYTF